MVHIVKIMVFPVVIYRSELNHTETWVPKNWSFRTVVLEKTLESPLDSKKIKPVHPKGNQLWIFIGRTDTEALILWPPDVRSQLFGKTLMLVKIEGRRRTGWQRMKWLDNIINSVDISLSKLGKIVKDREAWHAATYEVARSQTWLTYWTFPQASFLFHWSQWPETSFLPNPMAVSESWSLLTSWLHWVQLMKCFMKCLSLASSLVVYSCSISFTVLIQDLFLRPRRVLKYPNYLFFPQPSLSNGLNTVYKLSTLKFISPSLTFHLIPRLIFSCLHLLAVLIGIF